MIIDEHAYAIGKNAFEKLNGRSPVTGLASPVGKMGFHLECREVCFAKGICGILHKLAGKFHRLVEISRGSYRARVAEPHRQSPRMLTTVGQLALCGRLFQNRNSGRSITGPK